MKRIVYIVTSGVSTPDRLYTPFTLAMTARAMDVEAAMFFIGLGMTVMQKGEAEKIQVGKMKVLKDVIGDAVAAGVKLFVCANSTKLLGMDRAEFIPDAVVAGTTAMTEMVLESDSALTF